MKEYSVVIVRLVLMFGPNLLLLSFFWILGLFFFVFCLVFVFFLVRANPVCVDIDNNVFYSFLFVVLFVIR